MFLFDILAMFTGMYNFLLIKVKLFQQFLLAVSSFDLCNEFPRVYSCYNFITLTIIIIIHIFANVILSFQRGLNDAMFIGAMKHGTKWGLKTATFVGIFM